MAADRWERWGHPHWRCCYLCLSWRWRMHFVVSMLRTPFWRAWEMTECAILIVWHSTRQPSFSETSSALLESGVSHSSTMWWLMIVETFDVNNTVRSDRKPVHWSRRRWELQFSVYRRHSTPLSCQCRAHLHLCLGLYLRWRQFFCSTQLSVVYLVLAAFVPSRWILATSTMMTTSVSHRTRLFHFCGPTEASTTSPFCHRMWAVWCWWWLGLYSLWKCRLLVGNSMRWHWSSSAISFASMQPSERCADTTWNVNWKLVTNYYEEIGKTEWQWDEWVKIDNHLIRRLFRLKITFTRRRLNIATGSVFCCSMAFFMAKSKWNKKN